jgi:hypothetical protein
MNDWGQDIFQVDQSLGIGGLGVVSGGKAVQVGPSTLTAEVHNTAIAGEARVRNAGFDDGRTTLQARYTIHNGQALTFVDASAAGARLPIATGFRHHAGVTALKGESRGEWNYFATWGRQDLTNDELGLALFYRRAEVAGGAGHDIADDGQSYYLTFRDPRNMHYAFGATWAQDGSGVRSLEGFQGWLDATVDALNAPVVARRVQVR